MIKETNMLKQQSHSTGRSRSTWLWVALLLVSLAGTSAFADKKPKPSTNGKPQPERIRASVNRDLLVWPNPPAIARIKWLDQFTGEPFDASILTPSKKKKQGWMDRLAGAQPDGAVDVKIPYQLIRPYGITVDSKGKIYTADEGVDAIFIFDPQTKAVELIRNGHEAHFGLINGLAIDDNDRLFVTDGRLRQVLVFNAKHQQDGAFGADVLARPGGIALDRENRFLYVVDTENDQVVVFDADSFKVLRRIGVSGKKHTLTAPGTFSLPTNVALDREGNVYVTDTLNNRVQIFDPEGNFISMFGKHGDGPGYFARPKGIAVDSDGHIWVVDTYQDRVQVFNREGRLLIYVGGHGGYPGQFADSYGIAISKDNHVIVSEQYPGRLQMFQYVTDNEAEQARKKQTNEPEQQGQKPAPASTKQNDNAVSKPQGAGAQ
ncbi:MAG TPA: SMP-30/gluconolactonase/LRE family protein [Candidatus Limnocylindrales bacterium]|jgi:DNA-binding beta-propeller fold protein YncE|nr:SMP-30/gluconolactonase/LRE family protein [Candidatus Limnocylindrales bacterium]